MLKIIDKSKYVYSGYKIPFDSTSLWNFGNDFAKNVVISGLDNSSSSHADNCKNKILVLGDGLIDDINDSIGTAAKDCSINFSKAKTNFCLSITLQS